MSSVCSSSSLAWVLSASDGIWIKPADAAPDDGGFAVDVPVDSSVEIAAFSADDDLGEAVVAGVDPLLAGRGSDGRFAFGRAPPEPA